MKKPATVNLMIRVKTQKGHRYLHPVFETNKRKNARPKLKAFYALVESREEYHPEGVYALRIGRDYQTAQNWSRDPEAALCKFEGTVKALNAMAVAKAADLEVLTEASVPAALKQELEGYLDQLKPKQPKKRDFAQHVDLYVTETKNHKEHKTYLAYKLAVRWYLKVCGKSDHNPAGKTHLEDLDRNDVMHLIAILKTTGNSDRTVRNIVNNVKTFHLHYDLPWPMKKKDMPKYTKKKVESYDGEDLLTLLRSATEGEIDLICFFLWTGGREQDVEYATWPTINFHRNTFWIRENTDLGYTPKDREEAPIPLPRFLLERLAARKKRYPDSHLIFPTKSGKPNGHILRIVKDIALRAKLNCGSCMTRPRKKKDGTLNKVQTCKTHAVCKRWTLHQFRRTFATFHHTRGTPVNTIRLWLRHSELETTLRYLASVEGTEEIETIKAVAARLWSGDFLDATPRAA